MKPALRHPLAIAAALTLLGMPLAAMTQALAAPLLPPVDAAAPPSSPEVPATATELLPPAASIAAPKRPKICLVLSGGGARGAAHTGVLRVLEELRVPIHCITGTSMGALVGGAYATGMSVDEMDEVNAGITVAKLFKEKPPRLEMTMRRKADDHANYIGPEIGLGSEEGSLTKGAVSGVQLETVLRQLSKVRGYRSFDALPIQFRAVATDLVTGKAVVFGEGDMANVMRASMSVPGAVAPAEINGMMLVDGMLTSNLPVAAARELGADVVIAVNVGTPLLKREQLSSIFGVAGQMLSILTEQNVQASIASLKPGDILISPELGDYSTADFNNLPKISPLGETAARKVAEQLSRYSVSPEEYALLRSQQSAPIFPDLKPVDEIRFVNLKRVNPAEAQKVLQTTVHEPIDQEELDADMRRLYGTGDFEHVNYRTLQEGDRRVLAIDAMEKSWGPTYLRVGLALDTDFGSETNANLLASVRRTWINSMGAEWRTDLSMGGNNRLRSEFYQPFQAGKSWFIAPTVDLSQRLVSVYEDNRKRAIYSLYSGQVGLDIGRSFYQYGVLRMGVVGGRLKQDLDTGDDLFGPKPSRVKTGGLSANLVMDRLDSVLFPREGWHLRANLYNSNHKLGADLDYSKWEAGLNAVYSVGENSFNFGLYGGGRLSGERVPGYDSLKLGGFLRLSGFAPNQLIGQELTLARMLYYRRISQGSLLEGLYGGFSLETGRINNPLIQSNSEAWRRSASVFIGTDTFVGPLYLAYGRTFNGPSSFYLLLGPAF
ncbi:patatin-like phospholipase family protein [Paucibacter sp. B2R-40]|uniref:patatin-like phospholipase family protein n=1 Tax=Paucibacter sp. B2R-40 TaxID=2893554 RepID=UPI0021E381C1|nr:patatin-like phospholipase family protein [Paucibacter sp. B2R-40]MCV2352816.1 patatin-like phospholipase family protein [Paucibacter sp. B2R-40]